MGWALLVNNSPNLRPVAKWATSSVQLVKVMNCYLHKQSEVFLECFLSWSRIVGIPQRKKVLAGGNFSISHPKRLGSRSLLIIRPFYMIPMSYHQTSDHQWSTTLYLKDLKNNHIWRWKNQLNCCLLWQISLFVTDWPKEWPLVIVSQLCLSSQVYWLSIADQWNRGISLHRLIQNKYLKKTKLSKCGVKWKVQQLWRTVIVGCRLAGYVILCVCDDAFR